MERNCNVKAELCKIREPQLNRVGLLRLWFFYKSFVYLKSKMGRRLQF